MRSRPLALASALFAAAFILLSALVLGAELRPTLWDAELTRLFGTVPDGPWGELMEWVSAPGYPPWNWVVPGAMVGLLLLLRRFWEAAFMALASLGGLAAGLVKLAVDRPRPPPDVVRNIERELHGLSFPSGHVVDYVVVFGFIFYLAFTLLPPGSGWRRSVLATSTAMIVLVGPSRLYTGTHWASDVLAGYALGFTYLLLVIQLHRELLRRRVGFEQRTQQHTPERIDG